MKPTRLLAIFSASVILIQSCLFENDMSYPKTMPEISAFEVEGQKSVSIDREARTVEVELEESADINALKVLKIQLNDGASFVNEMPAQLDLGSPYTVNLKIYREAAWTISAVQDIERHISCSGQLGSAEFNVATKTALVYVASYQSLSEVTINSMKLEAEGSEIVSTTGYETVDGSSQQVTRDCSFPMALNCVLERSFKVHTAKGEVEWKLKILKKDVHLEVTSVIPWAYSAEITVLNGGQEQPSVALRRKDGGEWRTLKVSSEASELKLLADNLEPGCSYVVKAESSTESSREVEFTTCLAAQLPGMDFDNWYQGDPHQTWYPAASESSRIWDTANKGTNMFSPINPTRPEYSFLAVSGEGKAAARMESQSALGMFAAANIVTGSFIKASISGGVGAVLKWGVPFNSRPSVLKGWYCYEPKTIDTARAPYLDLKGTPDKCQILVLLTDWDEPFTISTAEGIFVDQAKDPGIIASGCLTSSESTGGKYIPFELPLEYKDLTRIPKYVVVLACSSLYGDYFTGGLGSVMYVDEFSFEYK